jgi:sugar lactone lactonase YvrE
MKNSLHLKIFSTIVAVLCFIFGTSRAQTITTYAGSGSTTWSGDGGPASAAGVSNPMGIISDGLGNIYFCDQGHNRIRKIDVAGIISEVAGNGSLGFSGDHGPATAASFHNPAGLAMDATGNLYVSDELNHIIRKIDKTGIITTIAGTPGVAGYSGDGFAATNAKFNWPYGLMIDLHGDLYVSDHHNHALRKITMSTGVISAVCGNGSSGFSGDGGMANLAVISFPTQLFSDAYGNLYFADNGNARIRKIDISNTIATIAGGGISTMDGVPATNGLLTYPGGVRFDAAGNLYITSGSQVKKVTASGLIYNFAGASISGYSGDGGPATSAKLDYPIDIAIDPAGSIYIGDFNNNRIRAVQNNKIPAFVAGHIQTLNVCFNSGAIPINSLLTISDADIAQTETWTLASPPNHGVVYTAYTTIATGGAITPTGTGYAPDAGYMGNDTFKVRISDGIASDTTVVYVTTKPAPSITGGSTVAIGANDALTDLSGGGGTWSSSNTSVAIVGSSSGIVTGISKGTVVIYYQTSPGCISAMTISVGTTGIRVLNNDIDLAIIPNPNNGIFSIMGSINDINDNAVAIEIANMMGQAIYKTTLSNNRGTIDGQIRIPYTLPAGLYLLKAQTGINSAIYKFQIK